MKLSEASEKVLDIWCNNPWSTGHFHDENRFYNFINQYYKDHGHTIDHNELYKTICTKTGTNTNGESDLNKIIRDYLSKMQNILEFLNHTGR